MGRRSNNDRSQPLFESKSPRPVHCDRLVTLLRDPAKEATEAAAMHKLLAGVAR